MKSSIFGIFTVIFALALTLTGCPEPDPTHTHTYSTTWSTDATQHWHECTANDGAKTDIAPHQWQWEETAPATTEADGLETETCKTCGETRETKPIAKLPDDPIQNRSGTVKVFNGTSTVTVQVKGMTTKAEWDDIANKIAGRLNGYYNDNENTQNLVKGIFDDRGVIYIVEPNPVGYNTKTIGDGKTVYIALDKVDSTYVEDAILPLYLNSAEEA